MLRSFLAVFALAGTTALSAGCGGDNPASPTPSNSTNASTATANPTTGPTAAVAGSITGRWRDQANNVFEFSRSGLASFDGQLVGTATGVCAPVNMTVAAKGDHYEGKMAFYQLTNGVCGALLGEGAINIYIEPTGATAVAKWGGPQDTGDCQNCAAHAWTKEA